MGEQLKGTYLRNRPLAGPQLSGATFDSVFVFDSDSINLQRQLILIYILHQHILI